MAAGVVTRTTSKPAARASASTRSLRLSFMDDCRSEARRIAVPAGNNQGEIPPATGRGLESGHAHAYWNRHVHYPDTSCTRENADANLASDLARPDRRPDRVHSGLVHGAPAAGRAFPGFQFAGQNLRGADPARSDPGHSFGLHGQAAAAACRPAARRAYPPLRAGRAGCLPAGRRHRCRGAQVHQDGAVRDRHG